jgi:hypothetical protein
VLFHNDMENPILGFNVRDGDQNIVTYTGVRRRQSPSGSDVSKGCAELRAFRSRDSNPARSRSLAVVALLTGAVALAVAWAPSLFNVQSSAAFGWKQVCVAVLGGMLVVFGSGLLALQRIPSKALSPQDSRWLPALWQRFDRPPLPPPRWGRADLIVVSALVLLGAVLYVPYATHAGWYYDDWDMYSRLRDAGGFRAGLTACADTIPGGRDAACIFHAAEYGLLDGWRTGYHLVSLFFLLTAASLLYEIVRRCHVSRLWAAAVAALLVTYPASDSTRLWPVSSIGEYVIVLQLVGLLLALQALKLRGRAAVALHVASIGLALLAMITYEIAVPLVALQGLVYVAAFRSRRVIWRGIVDFGVAAAFVIWRLAFNQVDASTGFVVHRTPAQTLERARVLLEEGWHTWQSVFAPGTLGVLCLLAVGALTAFVGWRDRDVRPRLLTWALALGIAVVMIAATDLVFITANDLYVPQVNGTFNRLNLPGAAASCVAFVAVVGMAYEAIRRLVPSAVPAAAAAGVLLAVALHQASIERDHQDSWRESWRAQNEALGGYQRALRGAPSDAAVMGFDTPVWERGWVPVFSATWDLRGAIDYTTRVDPPAAAPWLPGASCGPRGIDLNSSPFATYENAAAPLYFVSPARSLAVRVRSKHQCGSLVAKWGPPPMWGRTVTASSG